MADGSDRISPAAWSVWGAHRDGGDDVCDIPEVGGLQTCRTSLIDAEDTLEMTVQGVEKTVTEAPEEEEDGDQADGQDRLA